MTGQPPADPPPGPGPGEAPDRLPPVTELAVAALALVIVSGIYLASFLPAEPALGPAIGLVVGAAVLLATAGLLLARLRRFAWRSFFVVARWGALAYLVIAGVLTFVFVRDGTRGGPLALLLASLALFAAAIPLILGFTVARHADPVPADGRPAAPPDAPGVPAAAAATEATAPLATGPA